MTQYRILNIERTLPDSVCATLHWTASKTNDEFTTSAYGSVNLPAKDPSDPTFVPYKDITEAQAIEWTLAAMGEEAVAALDAGLDAQIEMQRTPVIASGTPWASVS